MLFLAATLRPSLQQKSPAVLRFGALDVKQNTCEVECSCSKTCSNSSAEIRSVACPRPVGTRKNTLYKTMSSLPEVRSRLRAGPGLWRVIVVLIRTGGRLRAPNAQHSVFRV